MGQEVCASSDDIRPGGLAVFHTHIDTHTHQ